MQSPIYASVTMSESTLLVVCYCLYTCIFFLFYSSHRYNLHRSTSSYISQCSIFHQWGVSQRLWFKSKFLWFNCSADQEVKFNKKAHMWLHETLTLLSIFLLLESGILCLRILFLTVSSSCVVAYHCNTFYWHVLHCTKYSNNFILFYFYVRLRVPQFK